jgi:DNA-binding LytR/AlgR family response regulator
MKVLIIEDELPAARRIEQLIRQQRSQVEVLAVIDSITEAVKWFAQNPAPELILMDIHLADGLSFDIFKSIQIQSMVIFTTAYDQYAIRAFKFNSIDYLLKPITLERFLKAMEKINQRMQGIANQELPSEQAAPAVAAEPAPAYIFVKDGTKLVKVKLSEIMYVEGMKDYVAIHTPQQRIVTLQRLKAMEEQLPESQFIRIHNSYIVALEWLDSIHKEKVKVGNALLPISDSYRKSFKDFIEKNHIKMD